MALSKCILITGLATVQSEIFAVPAGPMTVEIDAYIKVEHVSGTKSSASATVSFSDDENGILFSNAYDFTPSMDGGNFIKQAYEYLKNLPEFAEAVDC